MSTHSNRLYDHFQSERDAYGRFVVALASLGIFFALAFRPYLSTLSRLAELDRELTAQAESIAAVQQEIGSATSGIQRAIDFMGDASAFQTLYDDMSNWVSTLEDTQRLYDHQSRRLASLRREIDPADLSMWQLGTKPPREIFRQLRTARPEMKLDDRCWFLVEETFVQCLVNRALMPIRNRLERVLYDRTMSYQTTALKTAIAENQRLYAAGFAAAIARAELAAWVRDYLEKEKQIIRSWYEEMAQERMRLLEAARDQQTLLEENQAQRDHLESRKAEISRAGRLDTPVGPLPSAFHDLLAFFPLILLLTGTMLLRSHQRMLTLRQQFRERGPADETHPDAVAQVMPLWLDPLAGPTRNVPVLALLALPACVALVGLGQFLDASELNAGSSKALTISTSLLATVVFALLYAKLVRTWRAHRPD